MSEQNGTQASMKRRRSRQTSKQNRAQAPTLQRPTTSDREAWKAYWKAQGQYWRTEPEIDAERQKYLAERRNIKPDIEQGTYPFKDIKLNRDDVEWLLATHEDGRGPIDWLDVAQWKHSGLDLRGANLSLVDLSNLPLARLHGGLASHVHGNLSWREWFYVTKEQGNMAAVLMKGANLRGAHLEGADLRQAHLERADLRWTHLEEADLRAAHLERTDLRAAFLERALLVEVTLGDEKHIGPQMADIRWGDVNLAVVNWSQVEILGDDHKVKDKVASLIWHIIAVRANRQLAVALQAQGMNEDASRFSYHAQKLQRGVLRLQRKIGQYLFSGFLDLLAGYGYKPWRSFVAYLLVIMSFATAYYIIGRTIGPVLSPLGSLVFSMTSFHGRGFFPGGISLDDPLTVLAALEAFVGLLIEVTFIATLTQRLFGK